MSHEKASDLFHLVAEVKKVNSKDEANRLLSGGWVLLAVASGQEQVGPNDYIPTFGYCLGRLKA